MKPDFWRTTNSKEKYIPESVSNGKTLETIILIPYQEDQLSWEVPMFIQSQAQW